MANDYDDYGYEDDNRNESSGLSKRIIIVILIVIAIILIIYLLSSCGNKNIDNKKKNETGKFDYESALVEAGKTYFRNNIDETPVAPGECNVVELDKLIEKGLLNSSKFGNCNVTSTYVRMCVLENGTKQYTPWLTCTDKDSESEYTALTPGNLNDIVVDKTYTEFKFLPQELKADGNLGEVEELWKDEIKYKQYKTLGTTTYYRYRDLEYKWDVTSRQYYTRGGTVGSANEVTEYYTSSPADGFNNYDSKTTEAYKWYTTDSVKVYWTGSNGAPQYAMNGKNPSEYPYRDPEGVDYTMYRTRNITGTYAPKLYYVCSTSASSNIDIYQTKPCGEGTNANYTYEKEQIYSCAESNGSDSPRAMKVDSANAVCNKYSEWGNPTRTQCDTRNQLICQSLTITFYKWYKLEAGTTRSYYPSGSTTAGGEKVYYTEAPIKDAIKDTTTKATAYKWYRETKSRTDYYSAVAPSGYATATKTNDSRWSDWSGWSSNNPKTSDGRQRDIETKTKIRLQEIKSETNNNWINLADDYVTEERLISIFKEKGYDVKTLEDITNNGQIRYQLKMFVRNKKETR